MSRKCPHCGIWNADTLAHCTDCNHDLNAIPQPAGRILLKRLPDPEQQSASPTPAPNTPESQQIPHKARGDVSLRTGPARAKCQQCGQLVEAGSAFCNRCGASLSQRPASSRQWAWLLVGCAAALAAVVLCIGLIVGLLGTDAGRYLSALAVSTSTATATATATPTDIPTATSTATNTFTPVPTPSWTASPTPIPTATSSALTAAQVIATIKPATVRIVTNLGSGSGFVLDSRGYVATNYHVVQNARTITVYLDGGRSYAATLLASDRDKDLAVLQLSAGTVAVARIGDSNQVEVGDTVIAVGFPVGLGGDVTATRGMVSAKRRITANGVTYIQTDAPINAGNSGGPLVNMNGEVVGINSLAQKWSSGSGSIPVDGIGFSIAINDAIPVLRRLSGLN